MSALEEPCRSTEWPSWVESGLTRTEHQGEQEVRQPVKITVQRYEKDEAA